MSISAINSSNTSSIGRTQLNANSSYISGSQDSDGDNDASRISKGRGKFANAISQALSTLGVSSGTVNSTQGSSNTSDTTAIQDPQQALASFMQNLFAALHMSNQSNSTNTGQTNSTTGGHSDGDNDGRRTSEVSRNLGKSYHHQNGGGTSKLESDLQNLIQQLSTSSNTSTSGSTSATSNLDALQQGFNSLMTANGVSSVNGATLSNFLQSLSQSLQGAAATGNIVTTKV